MKQYDTANDAEHLALAVAEVVRIGAKDEEQQRAKTRTGKELAQLLCSGWRFGHERLFAIAYKWGRVAKRDQ